MFRGGLFFLFLLAASSAFSQNVGINSTGAAPDASAGLDVSFTDKGLLVPRVALTATNSASPVSSPTTSLLVYNTATAGSAPNNVVPGYYYWNGTSWVALTTSSTVPWTANGSNIYYNGGNVGIGTNTSPSYKLQVNATANPLFLTGLAVGTNTDSLLTIVGGVVKKLPSTSLATPSTNAWSLSGNASLSSNFLGSTNLTSLRMRTNNTQRLWLDSLGSVAVGTTPTFTTTTATIGGVASQSQREKFLVDAGTTTSWNVISGKGSINNYLQLNIQNRSTGTSASSDLVASADNASELVNYVDLGVNSSGYNNTKDPILNGANLGYLYSTGNNNFVIGNATTGKDLIFFTDGTATADEKMRITSDGNVGIGTNSFDSTQPEKLLIDGGDLGNTGTTAALTLMSAVGTTNNYIQAIVQNKGYGNNSSSDFIVQNDGTQNGAKAVGFDNNYVDFGINSTGYLNNNSNILNQPSRGYLYSSAPESFYIGNGYPNKDIVFFTNYGTLNKNNTADGFEVMRIKGGTTAATQQVTIGTDTPNGTNKLTVNGSISASAFNVSSDRRLKDNIRSLNYGLKAITALKPVTYNWKDASQSTDLQIGLIAQDAKKIIPEIVTGDVDKGMLSVNYIELVPVLINAIKEQQAQIDELKKSVQKLQSGTSNASVK
ncbi:MAG: hypothetical protein K0S09_2463 [Sphingobacteriaceae bacterium]|jgi:hypothetical protein|nr:hypothetical protein [Sphingobacteriaceae bacterium]